MIHEWKPSPDYRNYGDALGEVVVEALQDGLGGSDIFTSEETLYFPIGSVIVDSYIKGALEGGMTPVFVGRGWAGAELTPELAQQANYLGCRGPETRKALERAGVYDIPIYGDTAYIALDYLNLKPSKHGKTVLMPHIYESSFNFEKSGVDVVCTARVKTRADIESTISLLSGADFVLANAMHACITAHAYGVPFAIYSPGETKESRIAEKWYDWLASIGVVREDVAYCSSVEEGMAWHEKNFYTP